MSRPPVKRYPWEPLARALATTEAGREGITSNLAIARFLDVDPNQVYRWKRYGLSLEHAEKVAHRLGRISYEVWPEILDEAIADAAAAEAARIEKRKANRRAYYLRNREALKAYQRARYRANGEALRQAAAARYRRNREARLAAAKKWEQENRERINARRRERWAADPERRERVNAKRRKRQEPDGEAGRRPEAA